MNQSLSNRITFSLLAGLFLLSCTTSEKTIDKDQLKKLPISGQKTFLVDSVTVNKMAYPQVLSYEGKEIVTSMNVLNYSINALKLFDLETGKLYKSLSFHDDEKYKLSDLLSVYIISPDSILCIDQLSNLYLLNKQLQVVNKYSFKNKAEKGLPLFYDNIIPLVKIQNGKYVAANYYTSMPDRRLNVTFDLKSDTLVYLNNVPEESVIGFYGIVDFKYWNYVYDEVDKKFVFNYPNLDSLYLYDSNLNLIQKVSAKSGLKQGPTEKLVSQRLETLGENIDINKNEVMRKMKNSFVYTDLIFNHTKRHYYRIVGLPISEFDIDLEDEIKSEIREYTLMVLDDEFNIIDEFLIPFNMYRIKGDSFFVYEGKLYLQRNNENEDEMVFDILDI